MGLEEDTYMDFDTKNSALVDLVNMNASSALVSRADFSRSALERYKKSIRRSDGDAANGEFWDLVVLSAGDESQRSNYLQQLEDRKSFSPKRCRFRVFSDPGGVRVGDGGSTLHILKELSREFGDAFRRFRTLVIHAGGYSKRLPSHSCCSKIFSALPVQVEDGEAPFQMLDMKLFMYLPLLPLMRPGDVFFTASDDLESYHLTEEDLEEARKMMLETARDDEKPFLCSLAHPSTLAVGTGHGVFRFSPTTAVDLNSATSSCRLIADCQEVLQKPSLEKMRDRGLIVDREFVYTDSAYWINSKLAERLARLGEECREVMEVETSIYSDFMTCQGLSGDKEHVSKLFSTGCSPYNLDANLVAKRSIFKAMGDVPLMVLVMPNSKFYHIGTVSEYLDAFSSDPQLAREFGFARVVRTKAKDFVETEENREVLPILNKDEARDFVLSPVKDASYVLGCVIASSLPSRDFSVPERCVVEFSSIGDAKVQLEADSVISNCSVDVKGPVPGNRLYHTVPVKLRGRRSNFYVTVSFSLDDDLKLSYADAAHVKFGKSCLGDMTDDARGAFKERSAFSLWNARIFTPEASREESFRSTLELVKGGGVCQCDQGTNFSMADVLKFRDDEEIQMWKSSLSV